MTASDFTDEILMCYADGELDSAEASRLERALETDLELASRLSVFTETRTASKAAMKPLLDEPVPSELKAAVEAIIQRKMSEELTEQTAILPFPKRSANLPAQRQWMMPIAASLVVAALSGLAGYWLATDGGRSDGLQIAGIDRRSLSEALTTHPSGEETQLAASGQRFRAIATFRNAAQTLCREFEVDSPDRSTVVSVACHSGPEWQMSFVVIALGNSTGYAPASSTEALDAYLSAIQAEAPMSKEEEANALRALRDQNKK